MRKHMAAEMRQIQDTKPKNGTNRHPGRTAIFFGTRR